MDRLRGHLGFKGEKGDTGEIGTPKVYHGLFAELQVDKNVDTNYHYIILNETDSYCGHWVYYDESDEVWLDGGLYQAEGIGEKSIRLNMLSEELQEVLRPLIGGGENE